MPVMHYQRQLRKIKKTLKAAEKAKERLNETFSELVTPTWADQTTSTTGAAAQLTSEFAQLQVHVSPPAAPSAESMDQDSYDKEVSAA